MVGCDSDQASVTVWLPWNFSLEEKQRPLLAALMETRVPLNCMLSLTLEVNQSPAGGILIWMSKVTRIENTVLLFHSHLIAIGGSFELRLSAICRGMKKTTTNTGILIWDRVVDLRWKNDTNVDDDDDKDLLRWVAVWQWGWLSLARWSISAMRGPRGVPTVPDGVVRMMMMTI